jgi:hypothetical protein
MNYLAGGWEALARFWYCALMLVENERPFYPLVESEWECVGFFSGKTKKERSKA